MHSKREERDCLHVILNEKVSRIPKEKIGDFINDFLDLIDSYIEE